MIITQEEAVNTAKKLAKKYNKNLAVLKERFGFSIVGLGFANENSEKYKIIHVACGK